MKRRRDPKTNLPIFPSWSWAGWVGKVKCNTNENLPRIEADATQHSGKDFRYPAAVNAGGLQLLTYRTDGVAR